MMQNLRENETNEMYFCHTRSTVIIIIIIITIIIT